MAVLIESIEMEMSEEQVPPTIHPLGSPALVIAGAGSGKTRVMTARVKWLIAAGVNPRRIAGITFTNKAADELRHRVGYGDDPAVGPRVSTIHALSLSAIRKDPAGFGLAKTVSPLDTSDSMDLMKRLIDKHKKDPLFDIIEPYPLMEKIGYHRARGVGFAVDYIEEVHAAAQKAHKGYHTLYEPEKVLWSEFEVAKHDASLVDFDDMLHLVVRRGLADDDWRTRLQKMFQTVLVDEAQDCNAVQWQFIELLLGPDNLNLFAVGDISQSIYGFAGASPETLGEMVESWRGVKPSLYKLEDNYRSLEKIVKFSNKIQTTMMDTVPLVMKHQRDSTETPGIVRLVENQTSRDIAQAVAETIAHDNVLKRAAFRYKDNAILVRSKGQIRDVEEALICRRIPYVVRGGQSLLQTEEARDLFSYLRLIVNPADVTAFGRAISVPSRKVGIVGVDKLRLKAVKSYEGDLALAASKEDGVAVPAFGAFLIGLRSVENLSEALRKVIGFADYRAYLTEKYRAKRDILELKLDNVTKIQDMISGLVTENPAMTPSDLIFRLTMNGKEEAKTEEGAVIISTIHSAKGLEWPRVYVTNVIEGSLPHQWSSTPKEVEEERRLFYVAATRARDALYLCVPALVQRGPNTARVEPSRFLRELGIGI